jgi:hypothetical protein
MALLVRPRCYWHSGGAAQENIDEAAEAKPIIQRAGELRVLWRTCGGIEVRPFRWDQRLTPVGENQNELQAPPHVRVPEDLQRLPLKGVMRAGDDHSLREVPKVGSVSWVPSTKSSMAIWKNSCGIGSEMNGSSA